ncbi:MAG: LysR family transcriptional regulator [Sphingomonadales bacterium]|nr:LysR family transcriptional regulator [Sphingomonadales bacterium]
MDNLAGMRVFQRVVEDGSFSAAGRRLGMAPSSVSRAIGDLERDLGARLFQRTTRKLSLTEAGQVYFERTGKILNDVDEARLAVGQVGGAPSGILRVTTPSGIGREMIVQALPDFLAAYPGIRVVLTMSDTLVDLVATGIDLGIRVGRLADSSLIARKIADSPRLLCASPGYIAREGAPAHPSELEARNCLTFRRHPGANIWQFQRNGERAEVKASGNFFAPDANALSAAAVAGMGLIILPDWNIGQELRSGALRPVLTDWQIDPPTSPIYAVYPHQRLLAPKVRVFIDFLVKRFAI